MGNTNGTGRAIRAALAGLAISGLALAGGSSEAATAPAGGTGDHSVVVSHSHEHGSELAPARRAKRKAKARRGAVVRPATAAPAPAPTRPYFMRHNADGSPVRYNPCEAIAYVINPANAPAGGLADVHEAVRRIAAATGLSFRYEGESDEIADASRGSAANPRYPGRFEPVLIGFHRPGETSLLNGSQVAMGGSTWRTNDQGRAVYVTGVVAVDAGQAAGQPTGFGSARSLGVVLLHELGHVVGLEHTPDRGSVMYQARFDGGATRWSPSDAGGLAEVGSRHGCVAPVAYPF